MDTARTACATTGVLGAEAGGAARSLAAQARALVARLHPSYFALVMATGVVAVASDVAGLPEVARFLGWTSVAAWAALLLLTVARAAAYPAEMLRDLSNPARAPGFFTTVAATAVVGIEATSLGGNATVGLVLWWVSAAMWAACMYSVLVAVTVGRDKPPVAAGIHGGWLVAVVCTQSLCALGCAVGPSRILEGDAGAFLMLSLWLCGGVLYLWLSSLIVYRTLFLEYSAYDQTPPFWINMGAVAISTLAGTSLVGAVEGSELLSATLPFVKGMTVLFWSTATWWIPLIVGLGIWRHHVRGVRLEYDPLYWGLVFPLGMYSLATVRLSHVIRVGLLGGISRVFLVAALVAWLVTFLGMAGRLLHGLLLALFPSPEDLAKAPARGRGLAIGPKGATSMTYDPHRTLSPEEAVEARVEARARGGRNLVLLGFVVAVIGVLVYCTECLGSVPKPTDGSLPASTPVARLALGLIGLGTLTWLVGSVRYLRAVILGDAVQATTRAAGEGPSYSDPETALGS